MQTIAKSRLGALMAACASPPSPRLLGRPSRCSNDRARRGAVLSLGAAWGNSPPWQPKPRRAPRRPAQRRADGREDGSALPKPTGPLVIVVSIGKQTVTVYDDGKKIAKSPISSGIARPRDADRHLLHPREEPLPLLEPLRRRADAVHAARHQLGRRHARGRCCRAIPPRTAASACPTASRATCSASPTSARASSSPMTISLRPSSTARR